MTRSAPRFSEFRLEGLIAATFTPLRPSGALNLPRIRPMVDQVIAQGARGLYVLGSTGEGPSLTTAERLQTAEAFVRAARGRVPVIVQVGHNSLEEARAFAAHAQKIGADAISATPAAYFKPESIEVLVECIAAVAGSAPKLPFYFYHLPALTAVHFNMVDFLRLAGRRVPTLRGVKFSDPILNEFQSCVKFQGGRYDILFGVDEMLLSGLAAGARGAVGSTFNYAAPLYLRIMAAFSRGNIAEASRLQYQAAEMIRVIIGHGGRGGLKATMSLAGQECGPNRLPIVSCTPAQRAQIRRGLAHLGVIDAIRA